MARRAIIIHGWEGFPEEGWFPWLKKELESRGFSVSVPQMPDAARPRIDKWIPKIAEVVGNAKADTYLVGHSMGCQAIARYASTLPAEVQLGGAVFVAGFFKRLTGLEGNTEVQETDAHWLEAPLDFAQVKSHIPKNIAIFSDDDPYVPLDNQDDFRDKLGSEIIVEHAKGHFSGSGNVIELPIALQSVLKIAQ